MRAVRPGRILLRVFLLFLVLLPIGIAWFHYSIESQWDRMVAQVRTLEQNLELRDPVRRVLYGETIPGNAWDDYEKSIAILERIPDLRRLSDYASPRGEDSEVTTLVLTEAQAAFPHLRRGTHRREARAAPTHGTFKQVHSSLFHLGMAEAHRLERLGEAEEALNCLLDALQYECDLTHREPWLGHVYAQEPLRRIHEIVSRFPLSRPRLQTLEQSLACLENQLITTEVIQSDALSEFGRHLIDDTIEKRWGFTTLSRRSWRHLYSWKFVRLEAFTFHQGQLSAITGPYRQTAPRSKMQKLKILTNPLLLEFERMQARLTDDRQPRTPRGLRATQTFLRLTRMTLAQRLEQPLPVFADPYGSGPLRHSETASTVKLWSVGLDGVDDEGSAPKDIVLEFPR